MSNTSKYEVEKLVAVALGKLIGREFKSKGWLERLVEEFDRELKRINSECKVKLYGVSYNVDHNDFAEILVYCNELGPMLVRIYVDFVERVSVTIEGDVEVIVLEGTCEACGAKYTLTKRIYLRAKLPWRCVRPGPAIAW
jgi:hypothetical protein